jgi:hypothetical protein
MEVVPARKAKKFRRMENRVKIHNLNSLLVRTAKVNKLKSALKYRRRTGASLA